MTRTKETYLHHYHRPETLQNRLRRQAEEEEHGQIREMIYSNSIQHLHSRQLNEEQSYTHCQELSQDKYRTKSIMRKEPKKYIPLSRQEIQGRDESANKVQRRKQVQYTQSEEYKRYHEQIYKNGRNSKEIMDRIKTLRSNNVYIAKEQAYERVTKRIQNHRKSIAQSNFDTRCLSNMSKITEKHMILINDPDFEEVELTCQPYLQSSSIFSNAYKQEMREKKMQLTPYHRLEEDQKYREDKLSATKVEKWKKKEHMRQSKQNIQKIAYSPSAKEPLKESSSIYNIDFKLDRPSNTSFTRCLSNLNLSRDTSISPHKSRKVKMLVVTASGRKPC